MKVKRGRWDRHLELVRAYGWSQPEIDASDPDFIEETLASLHALADEYRK